MSNSQINNKFELKSEKLEKNQKHKMETSKRKTKKKNNDSYDVIKHNFCFVFVFFYTFIINSNVLKTINIIIKYSNGVDTTMRHTLYLKLFLLLGIYRSNGRAPIVKSIHDFCKCKKKREENESMRMTLLPFSIHSVPDFYQFHRLAVQLHPVLEM